MCKKCFISFFCNRELNSGDSQLLLRKMRPYEQRFDCKLFFQYTENFACEVMCNTKLQFRKHDIMTYKL